MSVTLQRLDLRGVSGPLLARLPRPELAGDGPVGVVKAILADVKAEGGGLCGPTRRALTA